VKRTLGTSAPAGSLTAPVTEAFRLCARASRVNKPGNKNNRTRILLLLVSILTSRMQRTDSPRVCSLRTISTVSGKWPKYPVYLIEGAPGKPNAARRRVDHVSCGATSILGRNGDVDGLSSSRALQMPLGNLF